MKMLHLSSSVIHPNSLVKKIFSSRDILSNDDNNLWKIEQGFVRIITFHEDSTIVTLGIWGAGDIIGRVLSKTKPYQIECLGKVELSSWQIQDLSQLTQVLQIYAQQAEELMVIRSYKTAEITLIKLLEWLAKRFGKEVQQGKLIDLRLTHQDIADTIGINRVTVTRILQKLEEQGLIQRLRLQKIVLREEEIWHYEI